MSIHHLLSTAAASVFIAGSAQAITIYGLGTSGQLLQFDSGSPGSMTPIGGASSNVQLDFRRAGGQLYGLSASGATSTVNLSTGALTPQFVPSHTLTGGVTGFDFNPTADRMRLVGGGVNNFRMFPADFVDPMTSVVTPAGRVVDGATGGDGLFRDVTDPLAPVSVTLLDVAYENPFAGTTTTLYSISTNGMLNIHPSSGSPKFNDLQQVGSLGITLGSVVGFDIDQTRTGWLVTNQQLYSVDLGTGEASFAGNLGQSLISIAVVPEPSTMILGCVATLGLLRRRRTV